METPPDLKSSLGSVTGIDDFSTRLTIRSTSACPLPSGFFKLVIRWFVFCTLFFAGVSQAQISVISPSLSVEANGGRSTGALEVNRIELAFDNGLPRITTGQGQAISAIAVVNTLGNGLFRAQWRVDGQVVQAINHPVSFGSILRLTLSGPELLPTIETGGHFVSLEVLSPTSSIGNPEIRYFVTPSSGKAATLFTRPLGGQNWQKKALGFNPDGTLKLEIPSDLLVSPGVEYYIELTDADGRRRTDPAKNPIRQPNKIEIPPVTQASQLFIQGRSENRPASEPIRISLSSIDQNEIDLSEIRFVLDDIDVSGLMIQQSDSFLFDPPAALSSGDHVLIASHESSGEDITLAQMPFSIAEATDKKNTLYARGNMSFVFGENINSGDQSDPRNGNIALAFGGNQGDTEYSWNGININYDDNVDPNWDLSSGFTFTATNQNKHLEYGDISVNESDLTASGFSRRGLKARVDSEGGSTGLFIVSTEPVSGFDTGLSSDNENQVYGGSYSMTDLGASSSNIDLVIVAGQNAADFGDSVVSTEGPSRGETIGVHADTLLGETRFGFDLGVSSFDSDLNDSIDAETDVAYRVTATHPLSDIQLSASLLHYGADYATVANPSFSGDREGGNIGMTTGFGPADLNLQISRLEDNVDRDPSRSIVTSDAVSTGLSLAWPDSPRLDFNLSRSEQNSRREPGIDERVKNINQSFSTGIAHGGDGWQSSFSITLGELDDLLEDDNDSETRSYALTSSLSKELASLSASISTSHSESEIVENDSHFFGLNGSISLLARQLSLAANLNLQESTASDNSVDTSGENIGLVLTYQGGSFLQQLQKSFGGTAQLSLTISRENQENRVDGSETDDTSIFLGLNVGVPLDFENSW